MCKLSISTFFYSQFFIKISATVIKGTKQKAKQMKQAEEHTSLTGSQEESAQLLASLQDQVQGEGEEQLRALHGLYGPWEKRQLQHKLEVKFKRTKKLQPQQIVQMKQSELPQGETSALEKQ